MDNPISIDEAANKLNISPSALAKMRLSGASLQFVKLADGLLTGHPISKHGLPLKVLIQLRNTAPKTTKTDKPSTANQGAHQNMLREQRRLIMIDGEQAEELNFKTLHPSFYMGEKNALLPMMLMISMVVRDNW